MRACFWVSQVGASRCRPSPMRSRGGAPSPHRGAERRSRGGKPGTGVMRDGIEADILRRGEEPQRREGRGTSGKSA